MSLPGVGRTVLATLLAEASDPLRRRDYHALRCLCGVAPVTRSSGNRCIVVRRLAAHRRLNNAVYHWSRVAVQHDRICRAKYDALRTMAILGGYLNRNKEPPPGHQKIWSGYTLLNAASQAYERLIRMKQDSDLYKRVVLP